MKHVTPYQFFKKVSFFVLLYLCVGTYSHEIICASSNQASKPSAKPSDGIDARKAEAEVNKLKEIVMSLYEKVQGLDLKLPELLQSCYAQLTNNEPVQKERLVAVVLSALRWIEDAAKKITSRNGMTFEDERSPRPTNSSQPVGPGCCCNVSPVPQPQPIIINQPCCPLIEEHCPTVLKPADILPNGYTITNPGYYTLCGSVGFSGTSTCVIRIQSNNVTFDLNQNTLYQTNFGLGVVGICIDAGFSNVVIKSGKISGMTGDGIDIANGSEDIILSDVTVRGCGGAGISFNGTVGSKNRDVVIASSRFTNNGGNGGNFTFTEKVKISDSKFNDNIVVGASFSNSNANEITNSSFNKNGGNGPGASMGLALEDTGSSVIRNCIFNGNFSTTSSAIGLALTSTGNLVENCVADGNSTTAASEFAIGFDVQGTAHLLNNCTASSNSATGIASVGIGFRLFDNAFRCWVQNCKALTNSAFGFAHNPPARYNFFNGNISAGHGADVNNYAGAGIAYISLAADAQLINVFDNLRINNISITV